MQQKFRMLLRRVIPWVGSTDPRSLSFPHEIEQTFLDYYFKTTLRRTRLAILFGMTLYAMFYHLDILIVPDIKSQVIFMRFVLVVPISTIVFGLSFLKLFRRYYQLLSMIYILAAGEGIVMMTTIFPQYTETYYPGIILVLIFSYILSGLRFYRASVTGWIIVISYILGIECVAHASLIQHLDNYFFLIGSNSLLMFGGYFTEVFYRREFYLQYQLNQERDKIKEINVSLEARVEDRTKELMAEVSERKIAQEAAQKALIQKEILLREVYHRTKNNMNVVISLLNMQSEEQRKRPVEGVFNQIADRIYSMSLVHEQLYRSDDLNTIHFDEYVQKLVSRLQYSMPQSPRQVHVKYQCETIQLGLDRAVPLGLAVNEIITNSFKHGFPEGREGNIQITMVKDADGVVHIEIVNDGLPFSKPVNIENPETLGMHLIKMLIKDQLGGKISIKSEARVSYMIELTALDS